MEVIIQKSLYIQFGLWIITVAVLRRQVVNLYRSPKDVLFQYPVYVKIKLVIYQYFVDQFNKSKISLFPSSHLHLFQCLWIFCHSCF